MSEQAGTPEELVPAEPSQRFHGQHRKLGACTRDFIYRNSSGEIVLHVCRYRRQQIDETAPPVDDISTLYWTWHDRKWGFNRAAKGDLLFHLEVIHSRIDSPLYVLDSEENAEALQGAMDEAEYPGITTTFLGGLQRATAGAIQSILHRPVTIWVTNGLDKARNAALHFAGLLWQAGNRSVDFIQVPTDRPTGWNVESAIASGGWNWPKLSDFMSEHRRPMSEAPREVVRQEDPPVYIDDEPPASIGGSLMDKWRRAALSCASNGAPYNNVFNVSQIITASQGAYCDVWLDEFRDKIMTRGSGEEEPREWREVDTIELARFIQSPNGYGVNSISTGAVHDGVVLAASKQKRNEVREWLHSLEWDGKERLQEVMPSGWGTDDTDYYRAIGRCFVMGAAARILRPGCKVDTLPVFEGPQGICKSTALLTLASDRWYDEPSYDVGSLDFLQSLKGKWILEFAEMAVLAGRTGDKNNSVITRRVDTYRPSYGRMAVSYPRMCVFAATTNNPSWNDSEWGARRFWPVRCGKIDLKFIADSREQWFAEAVARIDRSELWHDVPPEAAKDQQASRIPADEYASVISDYLSRLTAVEMRDVLQLALGIEDRSKWTTQFLRRVTTILRRQGWVQVQEMGRNLWRRAGADETPPPQQADLDPDF